MIYFRRMLLFIRRMNNKEMKPDFPGRLFIVAIVGTLLGVIIDTLLPFNFFINAIRGIIANIVGFSLFGFIYSILLIQRRVIMKNNSLYVPLRQRFSFNQRVNISIVFSTIILFLMAISGSESSIYTLKGSVLIFSILMIILFVRKDRTEYLKDVYDIPDVRDIEFKSKKGRK